MKFEEVKNLPKAEIYKKKSLLVKKMFELKMKNSFGQLANPIEIRDIRKDIARLTTALQTNHSAKLK